MLETREKDFVDTFGKTMGEAGLPPHVGRLFGLLLIAEPPCQTEAEISQALGLPVAEVNQAATALMGFGMAEQIKLPDRPEACFCLKPLEAVMKERVQLTGRICEVLDRGIGMVPPEKKGALERLTAMRRLYGLMDEAMAPVIERWSREVARR